MEMLVVFLLLWLLVWALGGADRLEYQFNRRGFYRDMRRQFGDDIPTKEVYWGSVLYWYRGSEDDKRGTYSRPMSGSELMKIYKQYPVLSAKQRERLELPPLEKPAI